MEVCNDQIGRMRVVGNTDTPRARHLFLDMAGSVTVRIIEMQMQLATGSITPLMGMPRGHIRHAHLLHPSSQIDCADSVTIMGF
jgi:hypothetical protein